MNAAVMIGFPRLRALIDEEGSRSVIAPRKIEIAPRKSVPYVPASSPLWLAETPPEEAVTQGRNTDSTTAAPPRTTSIEPRSSPCDTAIGDGAEGPGLHEGGGLPI